ncbi:MAG: hypothetical protein ACP5NS_00135 [Candidatus Pacearchaeota archaeon]
MIERQLYFEGFEPLVDNATPEGEAIRLPSSSITLFYPNDDCDGEIAGFLVSEARERGYKDRTQKIIYGQRIRDPKIDWDKVDHPDDSFYIVVPRVATLGQLESWTSNRLSFHEPAHFDPEFD